MTLTFDSLRQKGSDNPKECAKCRQLNEVPLVKMNNMTLEEYKDIEKYYSESQGQEDDNLIHASLSQRQVNSDHPM
jgi:hypothetical protein